MKQERKVDIIFLILASAIFLLIQRTGNSAFLEQYSLGFVILAYFVGKGAGKGLKEKEWREKKQENQSDDTHS